MRSTSVVPRSGRVAACVERIWTCEHAHAAGEQLLLPTGRSQLVFGLDSAHPAAAIQGPSTRATVLDSAVQRRAIGVVFRPGGLRALTSVEATDFVDEHTDIGDVIDLDRRALLDELGAGWGSGGTIATLVRMMESRLARTDRLPSRHVARAAAALDGGASVHEGGVLSDLPDRRFRSEFGAELGMSPKRYARLRRFESAVACVRSARARRLSDIAADLGYADQSHMTRDFAEFAGVPPGSLHGDGSPAPNHVDR